jgi:hypothetical protein
MASKVTTSYQRAKRSLTQARRNIGRAWRIIEEAKLKLERTRQKSLG